MRSICSTTVACALLLASTANAQGAGPVAAIQPVTVVAPVPVAPPASIKAAGPADPISTAPEDVKQFGSLYLRCDGKPNNMTEGESLARLVGAITLLAIFAPSPEAPDPSKRLFGEAGVKACTKLLDDPKQETNTIRRLPLILGRAAHQIEARNYEAALADVAKARGEAAASGLAGNPYFERSLGLSFNILESAALLRLKRFEAAQAVGMRSALAMPHSFYAQVSSFPYSNYLERMSPDELRFYELRTRANSLQGTALAIRLEDAGRFAEAAAVREDFVKAMSILSDGNPASWTLILAAIDHALAGNWQAAEARAAQAQANMDRLIGEGKAEDNQSVLVEQFDLFQVLKLMHDGKIDEARRNFSARSRWTAPSFGMVLAVNSTLRKGARPEALFGALAMSPEQLRAKRIDESLAQVFEADKNNRLLFSWILPYANIRNFEGLSRLIWNVEKAGIIGKAPLKNSKMYFMSISSSALTQPDALLLHAALQAKQRGFDGFIAMNRPAEPQSMLVYFGRASDPDMPKGSFLNADAVIAELRQIIPSPDELAARRKAKT